MIEQFIKDISANWEMQCEYCRDCSSTKKKHSYEEIVEKYYDYKNLFFSTWLKDITKNRSCLNISKINRITIDIDFRKQYKEIYNSNPSDEEIIRIAIELWEYLKRNHLSDYWQWRYIVFSWNGVHLHYIWDIYNIKWDKDAELFREACLDFYKWFNTIIDDSTLFADEKVWDLWHLFRLPWTINEKNWEQHECKILLHQDIKSDVVNNIPLLLDLADKRIRKKQEEFYMKQKLKDASTKNYEWWVNRFEWINENVLVSDVIQILIPERRLKSDWKNFYNPAKWSNVNASYFVDKANNILIRNWSTKLPWTKEWLNPVSLVMEWFWYSWKECLDWFTNNNLVSKNILNSNKK